MNRKIIYVASPYSHGDIEKNVELAKKASRFVVDRGHVPITPHLLLPQFMSEENERELAIELNKKLLGVCDELWYFGNIVTRGMQYEILRATYEGIPVKDYTSVDFDFEYATGGYVDTDKFFITQKGEDFLDKLESELVKIMPNYESKKVIRHGEICDELKDMYKSKNADYGDSFGISYRKYGKISSLTRLSDKFNRIENILLGHEPTVSDETVIDTLTDLANYAIMTRMELEIDQEEGEKYCEEID